MTSVTGRRVLVTGATGFLGAHIADELARHGALVARVGSRDHDLTEQADVRELYARHRPHVVVHAAAAVGGIAANLARPGAFLQRNALMGLLMLEEGRRHGIDRFVLLSTMCAYPAAAPLPLREETMWDGPPTEATGPYGMAKRLLHEACRTYEEEYGMSSAVLVPTNLYGPGDHFVGEHTHVIPALISRYVEASRRDEPTVTNWGTGEATREFLFVTDAARAVASACGAPLDARPINVGTGVETSMRTLAEAIAQATGFAGRTLWDPSRPEGQPRRFSDTSRMREVLGVQPQVGLDEGIRRTVRWYLDSRGRGS